MIILGWKEDPLSITQFSQNQQIGAQAKEFLGPLADVCLNDLLTKFPETTPNLTLFWYYRAFDDRHNHPKCCHNLLLSKDLHFNWSELLYFYSA